MIYRPTSENIRLHMTHWNVITYCMLHIKKAFRGLHVT